jgi:4-azaleucine resistance transporter AzlC
VDTRRSDFLDGVRAELPILLGVSPFGLIYGVVALGAGIPAMLAFAMSSIVFAGSAQLIGAQMLGAGAPGIVVVLTTGIVNLRHILYGASIAPHLAHLSRRWRCLLAYLLTDEAYAVSITRFTQRPASPPGSLHKEWYFLGAGLAQWTAWQVSTAAGILLGTQVPPGGGLDFTVALTFIALVVPALTALPSVAAALSAGALALVATGLPYKLGLIVAALCGTLVGLLVEAQRRSAGHRR